MRVIVTTALCLMLSGAGGARTNRRGWRLGRLPQRPVMADCFPDGLGIHELLLIDDEVRNLTMKAADSASIRRVAASKGMNSLREDGAEKVLSGQTTIEEVLRVTQEDLI